MRHHARTGTVLVAAMTLALCCPGARAQGRQDAKPASPSLDAILKDLAAYDGGLESAASWKLRDYVRARKDDEAGRAECEIRLLAFLKTSATQPAKLAAAHSLRIVASERAVPALEALLVEPRSADAALYVLQMIPGPAPDQALLRALPKTAGTGRIAVIGALGQRRVADAVAVLAPLVGQPEFARPAAFALGAIGTDAAAQALAAACPRAQGEVKAAIAAAMLRCAEREVAAGNNEAAARLYEPLAADTALAVPLRRGAAIGRISASGSAAPAVLMSYLGGSDAAMQEAAIARVAGVFAPDAIGPVCAAVPRLPARLQVQLLAVLAIYPRERVLPTILAAARSESAPVRIAAMNGLATAGDATVVSFLIETAAGTRGDEQAAARSALGMLKGRAVDDAIVGMMAPPPPERVQAELLLAIADRRIFAAKPVVASALASTSSRVRLHALRSLRDIGTPSDIPAVLTLLVGTEDEAERAEAEKTTALLAEKIANPDGRASALRGSLMREKDPEVRAKLVSLLPLIGDNTTLPLLRTALADGNRDVADAAVRALTDWPTPAARDDVLRLARDSRNETYRLLAIRGLVRLIARDRYREPQAAVADLRQAASFAWRVEEQRLVLSALAQFPCREGIEMATGFLRETDVTAEAQAAIDAITERLKTPSRRRGT